MARTEVSLARAEVSVKKKGFGAVGDFLDPIKSKIKRKKFAVYDIESKAGDDPAPHGVGQAAGFTRPFLVGFYDPNESFKLRDSKVVGSGTPGYYNFRNEPHLKERPWQRRHILPGGCVDKLMNLCLTKQYSGYSFYAHNGGNFDHLFILAWLEERQDEYIFEVVPIQSTIQVIRVKRVPNELGEESKETWEFLDSMRLLPMGLETACKTFGLAGKVSFNLSEHEDNPLWDRYLKQDCIALAAVLQKTMDMIENLGGEVGITTPSTAMKLFRRRFMGKDGCPSRIPRWNHWHDCKGQLNGTCTGCCHDWIRRGYYGGRTEIFRLAGEKLHYYDINSSYVAAMRYQMPIGDRIVERGPIDWRKHWSEDNLSGRYAGFAECQVTIPKDCPVPPLPHRKDGAGKLIFPAGEFYGVWSLEELKLLTDPFVGGKIDYTNKTVWFGLRPMFQSMVDELWKFRNKKLPGYDPGMDMLAKLLGNSTYGKFAMKQERTSITFAQDVDHNHCFLCKALLHEGSTLCQGCEGSKPAMKEPDGKVWYQANKVDANYIIPHVASHITAIARVCLWNYMKMIHQLGGKLYYTDTDSLITDVELPTSTNLGKLKDEHPGDFLEYLAVQPKVYVIRKMGLNKQIQQNLDDIKRAMSGDDSIDVSTLGDPITVDGKPHSSTKLNAKVTMKGFPPSLRTDENLAKLRAGGILRWKQLQKVRSLARIGFKQPPQMKDIEKSFKSSYDKRIVLPDGSTTAIVLNERAPWLEEVDEAAQ